MSETPLVVAPRGRGVVGATPAVLASLATVAVFGVLGGPVGIAIAFVPVVALVAGGPLLAFIAGTVALLGVGEIAGLPLIPAHLVLASYLVAGVFTEHDRSVGVLFLAIVAIYAALFVIGESSMGGLTETTAVLAGLTAGVSYVIHRYELVVVGLVDE
ncbi:MAG: hypothetical protein V5A38_08945 [Halolamina sp.]|uniref:hypothetical protein n=1 Tax=Halolamina sp. TaxID=1940283 RepID=UPI002FC3A04B